MEKSTRSTTTGEETREFAPADILIVDDFALNRFVFKGYLKPYGFTLREANDGREAIAAVEAKRPDLILMDIAMPVMDGGTAVRILKENRETADIPVIGLTGMEAGRHKEEIETLFDGFLTKPVLGEELLETIRPFLKVKRALP